MRTVTGLLLAAALAVAGCARTPFAAGAGAHCAGPLGAVPVTLDDLVRTQRWAEVSDVRDAAAPVPYTSLRPATLTVARSLRGDWGSGEVTVGVEDGTVAEARAERAGHARLLAMGGPRTAALVSLRPDGSVHFLGGCAERLVRPSVERFRAIRAKGGDGRSEADLFLSLVTEPRGEAAVALHRLTHPTRAPEPAWRDRPADDRVLDSGAPADVLAGLEQRTIAFHLPKGWRGVEAQLCPRVAGLAWEVCTVPQAARGTVPLAVYVRRGAPVEVWLADRVQGFRGRRAHVLTIPYAAFASGTADVYGAADVATVADAWRLAGTRGALLHR
ncbi:MAG TPA: hypothetical protein VFQ85_05185 [Mycobacteriales bacterium]|jgi:hypothetical protein|nr:hypothetical protein [Mycobacteriales bacterium]